MVEKPDGSFWAWPGLPDLAKLLESEWGAFEDVARAIDSWREYRSEANDLWEMLVSGATKSDVTRYLTDRREGARDDPDPARDAQAAQTVLTWYAGLGR